MELEFYSDKRNEHRWRVVAANNKIVGASSESFKNAKDCVRNYKLVCWENTKLYVGVGIASGWLAGISIALAL